MSSDGVTNTRRRFLTGATCVVGAVGVGGAAVPFLKSWAPSAKAKAAGAPVRANLAKLEVGQLMTVEWRGQPVYIVRRTPETLENLVLLAERDKLRDPGSEESEQPEYIDAATRALSDRAEILVMIGLCTHLGCAPIHQPEVGVDPTGSDNESWFGGFFCPCHGSKFDLAGRVYQEVPAPTNLVVPPYRYESDSVIVIGEDQEAA